MVFLRSGSCIFNLSYYESIRIRFIDKEWLVVLQARDPDYYNTIVECENRSEAIDVINDIEKAMKERGVNLVNLPDFDYI